MSNNNFNNLEHQITKKIIPDKIKISKKKTFEPNLDNPGDGFIKNTDENIKLNIPIERHNNFDIRDFNNKFDQMKKNVSLPEKKYYENHNDIDIHKKNISDYSLSEIIVMTKNVFFEILDDLLSKKFDSDIILSKDRMFFSGIIIVFLVIIIFFFVAFS